jgi:hypothetical protein
MVGACGTYGRGEKVYRVLVIKPEGKRPLGRPKRRWEDGIRAGLGETSCGGCGLHSVGSGYCPVADFCDRGDEHSGSGTTELFC